MIQTPGISEKFKGSAPSISPTAQSPGVFSLCSGGVPQEGAFARIPGKTLTSFGIDTGGIFSIYVFGLKVVVQRYTGIEIFQTRELIPQVTDYVYDNDGNLVYDNFGFIVIAG